MGRGHIYPPELRERAVRTHREQRGQLVGGEPRTVKEGAVVGRIRVHDYSFGLIGYLL